MEETTNEEFQEALNISDSEYHDAEADKNICENRRSWSSNTRQTHTVSQFLSEETEKYFAMLKSGSSNFVESANNGASLMTHKETKDAEKFDGNGDVSKEAILEAILNEKSLKRIYFDEKCIPNNNNEYSDCSEETKEKINLWSYINQLPNTTVHSDNDEFSDGDNTLNTIDEEVKELELEIQQMFDTPIFQIAEPVPLQQEPKSSGGMIKVSNTQVPCKRKISPLPIKHNVETRSNQSFRTAYNDDETMKYPETDLENFNMSQSTIDQQDVASEKQSSDSEDTVTLVKNGSLKIHPVNSIEVIPKSIETQKMDLKKINIVENLLRANTLLENSNFFEKEESKTFNTRKNKSKPKISQEFRKVRSYTVNTESVKKVHKNTSKSFHFDEHSRSHMSMKASPKIEKKMKIDAKRKPETSKSKKNNKGINTPNIRRRNFCCQKIGAFIESANFCSISLTLESVHEDVRKNELMNSLKEYFWLTKSDMEKSLIQLVILCMGNNFQEIAISNENFRLYCQNEFSSNSMPENEEKAENSDKDSFKSNLVSQPLYIETILSQSQVNRLEFESKNQSSNKIQNASQNASTKEVKSCIKEEELN
ncbi:putative mediator of RNA polymerase II transcription subunit 26 [Harmonia axyridis]|uniref:putative mediator of RNA polymerase II transcription subunit 26 n=1 Tax=Harmonia axyridis TaxID=115357 RepID=UPI001E2774C7|nr:putative mediator of RNA polymerase II transcription subunit 26 [Harmonia axyridis]